MISDRYERKPKYCSHGVKLTCPTTTLAWKQVAIPDSYNVINEGLLVGHIKYMPVKWYR